MERTLLGAAREVLRLNWAAVAASPSAPRSGWRPSSRVYTETKVRYLDVTVRVRPIKFRTLISNWDAKNGFSIKSTLVGGNCLKLYASRLVHQTLGVPEMKRTGRFGSNVNSFKAISVPERLGQIHIGYEYGYRPTILFRFNCLQATGCLKNRIMFRPQHVSDAVQIARIVVQNKNAFHKHPLRSLS